MSDVPATMFAVLSVWCLVATPRRTLAAGLAAGASFLIRPGGLGVIVVLFLFAVWPRDQRRSDRRDVHRRPAAVCRGTGVLQWRLFGSPVTSGYGPLAMIYSGASVWHNLAIDAGAIWTIHSLVWFAGLLAAWSARPRTPLALAIATLIVSAVPYVLYLRVRSLGDAAVPDAGDGVAVGRRCGRARRDGRASRLRPDRRRHRRGMRDCAGDRVRALPAARRRARTDRRRAAVSAGGHSPSRIERQPMPSCLPYNISGSIRHYGDRLTLRWDLLRAEDFEPAMTALAGRGHPIYVVLEGREQGLFTSVFAAPLQHVQMYPFGQIRNIQIWELVR